MKNTFILMAGLLFLAACKTTEEKQEIAPISLSENLQARILIKGGKEVMITNRMENIRVDDIEKVIVLNDKATWDFLYKDKETRVGDIRLRMKSDSGIDREKILIVVDGVKTPKDFELNSLKTDRIKSVNVYKGASAKEKFNAPEFESVIEIFTK